MESSPFWPTVAGVLVAFVVVIAVDYADEAFDRFSRSSVVLVWIERSASARHQEHISYAVRAAISVSVSALAFPDFDEIRKPLYPQWVARRVESGPSGVHWQPGRRARRCASAMTWRNRLFLEHFVRVLDRSLIRLVIRVKPQDGRPATTPGDGLSLPIRSWP